MGFQGYSVQTPDGLVLEVREYGNVEGPPIVFIHGISQCQMVFSRQTASEVLASYRLITYDLRGHGESSKPEDESMYAEGQRWAGDLQAVLLQRGIQNPLLVGWSLGGRVISQYVHSYGDSNLAGVCFVGSRTIASDTVNTLGSASSALVQMCVPRMEDNIDATARFIRACVAQPLGEADFRQTLAYNMVVSPAIRAAVLKWPGDFVEALRAIRVPARVVHGRLDLVVTLAAAELTAKHVPHAALVVYDESGHTPFWEEPERFNQELALFAREVWSQDR